MLVVRLSYGVVTIIDMGHLKRCDLSLNKDVGACHITPMYSHISSTLMSTEWTLSSTYIEI